MKIQITRKIVVVSLLATLGLILVACGSTVTTVEEPGPTGTPEPTSTPLLMPEPTSTPSDPVETPTPPQESRYPVTPGREPSFDPAERYDLIAQPEGWKTDFSKHSVDYLELFFGGIARDAVPALVNPVFIPVAPDPIWLGDLEPVIAFELNGDIRGYPLQVMIWHEIVNDVVGGVPVIVTFCPLCNTALAFERSLDGTVYEFGVSGVLRFNDLVMYDRQTESWWQQIGGEAIVGEVTGAELKPLPASIVSWGDFRTNFPNAVVLSSRDTGYIRDYGGNPYTGYDDVNSSPFISGGEDEDRLPAVERVVAVDIGDQAAAYPFSELEKSPVVNDRIGDTAVAVFLIKGTKSALDSGVIYASRDIGATGVFNRLLDGVEMTFFADGEQIIDTNTGSTWNIFGQAIDGELAGKQLEPILHANHFWFAWAVFKPDTRVWRAP